MHGGQWDAYALPRANSDPGGPDVEDQGHAVGLQRWELHGRSVHRDREDIGAGFVFGTDGGGRIRNRRREVQVVPKSKPSTGTLTVRLNETPGVTLFGALASGNYSPLSLSGTVSEKFAGGSTCGVPGARRRRSSQEGDLRRVISLLLLGGRAGCLMRARCEAARVGGSCGPGRVGASRRCPLAISIPMVPE